MRKLLLPPLAALVLAACGDDDGGQAAADRDCPDVTQPLVTDPTTAPSTSTAAPATTAGPPPTAATTAPAASPTTTTAPSTSAQGLVQHGLTSPRSTDTTVPPTTPAVTTAPETTAGTASTPSTAPAAPATTSAPTTTYAPKPEVMLPEEVPNNLVTTEIETGTGPKAEAGNIVVVHYVGVRSEDGKEFDSNYDSAAGFPVTLGQGQVIQGWEQGLLGAQSGGKLQLDIPASLAYGDSPPEAKPQIIKPGDALSFVIEIDAVIQRPDLDDHQAIPPSLCAQKLQVHDLVVGTGAAPKQDELLVAHVVFLRGDNKNRFYNTWDRGQPTYFSLTEELDSPTQQAVPGFLPGLKDMRVGGRRLIVMPPTQAERARLLTLEGQMLTFGPPTGLPSNTDLIALVDVVSVQPNPQQQAPSE